MKFYAVSYPSSFANEFTVWAFVSRWHRDAYVDWKNGESQHGHAEPITYQRARQMCGAKYFENQTADGRSWGNVYPPNDPAAEQDSHYYTSLVIASILESVSEGSAEENDVRWVHGLCEPFEIGGGR